VLTEAEYQRLRGAASDNVRDLAIIELVLQTGLRLSEIARLTTNDVIMPAINSHFSLPVGHVRIAGRGAHSRTVTLNIRACEALSGYLTEREETDSPALFLTKFGFGIGPRSIENIVAKYCKQAGISGTSVHALRHTMATHMVKNGMKLDIVRQALGHTSLKTTGLYVDLARGDGRGDAAQRALTGGSPICAEHIPSDCRSPRMRESRDPILPQRR
jgi:integrase/recombinase XerD